ncbi:hypothetical protein A2Z00_02310 [Candidatus Gottesmanbacteria bacterium RBG_13_45_10]|uniref:Glycosyltransferase subfamily 4-like N-terminal domain-containing protein n=1 Tax=Candidatus Gottesmanbacteria bacterium RBG_13_45_10 TaxID=1798370 RepID=A0A1F5ZG64_9BACT|nr:MAG: hypothetical protein A2Z00_02310 [Candidatus Gottesmanbacteria bacterium RBG_13_45_10]
MRIGIDISQIVYEGTGVGNYVRRLVSELVNLDKTNSYVLFGASLRQQGKLLSYYRSLHCDSSRVRLCVLPIPPTLLDLLWNILHVLSIERFIGHVDVFWSSDWTQPPLHHARGITTIHDVSIFRYPKSFSNTIINVQKRRLEQAKKECDAFLCDSLVTKQDVIDFLHIEAKKLHVVYPGFS